jgi:hypothetical protein
MSGWEGLLGCFSWSSEKVCLCMPYLWVVFPRAELFINHYGSGMKLLVMSSFAFLMFSLRQLEQDVETVIHVLQPGPMGILEHKFTEAEILEARATVRRAVDTWRSNWTPERNLGSDSFDKRR